MSATHFFAASALLTVSLMSGANTLSLDSCRSLALEHNKQLHISRQNISKSRYESRVALAAYFPALDFNGGYAYNEKNLSLFDSDQMLPTKTFNAQTGSYEYNLVTNPATGQPVKSTDGKYIPQTVALIPKEAMTFDIHNVFFGSVTLTQPVFMGGKIIAMNRITRYAENIASQLHQAQAEDVIYAVDANYWQVVSLKAKLRLAHSYVNLLDTLYNNVNIMYDQGVATHSELLSVGVRLNEAQVDLTKVENAVTLSRMALAQLCGLPIDSAMSLADEDKPQSTVLPIATTYDLNTVYDSRHDLQALLLATKVSEQKSRIARASMLPNLAVIGAYNFSNPNMFNGYKTEFDGAFSVGATLSIPIWHWGGNYYKYRMAKADETIRRITLADARDKVALQVSQATFKTREAMKTFHATTANLESATENLRIANASFKEGMISVDNVMTAQTAWIKACCENIDAAIDVRLCEVYLSKVTGQLNIK